MKRIDNHLHQWPSMAQNPESLYSLLELDQSPQMIWQNPQNPNLFIQNSQNPNLMVQNSDLYPLISQNPNQNRYLMRENHQPQPQPPRYQMNSDGSLLLNPSFGELASLEDAMSRINLSSSQLLLDHYLPPESLNRMRSMSAGLGLLRSNPNASYLNRANRAGTRRSRWISDNERMGFSQVRANVNQYGGLRAGSVQPIPSIYGLDPRANSSIRYSSTLLELDQVKGRIANLAKTQEGSRLLLKKIDEQRPDQIELIFSELKDHVCDLIVDQFANGLIQKLFGISNGEQTTQLLFSLIKNEQKLLNICIHQHGTRAVQKMIECMKTPDQRFALVSALKFITVPLSKNNNGHHVIQQCFKWFPVDDTKCLLDEIANSCLEIAMDKSGCCVLQKSLTRAEGKLKDRLLAEVTSNALVLSEHPYGNYVVQFVLEMKIPHAEANIMERLMRNFVTLSMNKYGSNVVEKCMKYCSDNNALKIIQELIKSPDFLDVVQDPFGNYVIQTALLTYKGEALYTLARVIDICHPYLHSHLHGKKVLAVLAQTLGNRNDRM